MEFTDRGFISVECVTELYTDGETTYTIEEEDHATKVIVDCLQLSFHQRHLVNSKSSTMTGNYMMHLLEVIQ